MNSGRLVGFEIYFVEQFLASTNRRKEDRRSQNTLKHSSHKLLNPVSSKVQDCAGADGASSRKLQLFILYINDR